MAIDPVDERNHNECVRCGRCRDVCAAKALTVGNPICFNRGRPLSDADAR
jgi:ferredoxin